MLSDRRIKEAESNVRQYLADGLLKKQVNETAKEMYIENSNLSLETAQKLLSLENQTYQPYLWVIVSSYYAMYYIANAVLLKIGYQKNLEFGFLDAQSVPHTKVCGFQTL